MRKKLIRFAENANRENIIEPGKPLYESVKGVWNTAYFSEEKPLVVELGCGDGEYTVGMAQQSMENNHIGVDLKGDRLHQGSTQAIYLGLNNVGFLRTRIDQLRNFFDPGEISGYWLTFPDPRPRLSDAKRRLSHPRYLEMYRELCVPGGWFKFKTDNTPLFEYTLDVLGSVFTVEGLEYTFDLYNSPMLPEHKGIQTKYERIWSEKGEKIKYLKFTFKK